MSVTDRREFIRLDVGYLDNPKVADALDASPLAVLAHIESMTYSRRHRTDGEFVVSRVLRKVGASADDARVLIDLGLWDDLGGGKAELHDYLKHQESAEQIAKLSEAGKKGAAGRWSEKRSANGNADRTPDGSTNRNAEERRGEQSKQASPQPEFGVPALLASHAMSTEERPKFLASLKAAGVRNTGSFINALHRDGKLAGRIQEWREDAAAGEAVEASKPVRHNTADDEHLKTCNRCRRMVGLEDVAS